MVLDIRPLLLRAHLFGCKPLTGLDAVKSILLRAVTLDPDTTRVLAYFRKDSAVAAEEEVLERIHLPPGTNFKNLTSLLTTVI